MAALETTALDERATVAAVPQGLLIDGEWQEASGGGRFAVEDPATGETLCEVADATPADGLRALDAACTRFPAFAATAPRERGEILRRAFELMVERREQLALLATLEMGKPLAEARGEVDYAAEFLRWYAEEAVRMEGTIMRAPTGGGQIAVVRQPVGPCVLVTPWNFPLAMATRKVAPAVAAGCTAVLKPAALTPLCSLAFAALMEEAGLPAGVLNVVTTRRSADVVGALLADPRTRKVSFTGSTEIGRVLLRQAAENVLRSSMELGGNAPFLVFEDADLDAALDGAVLAKMRNGGQACTAANRFLVQRPLAEEFAARLAERLGALRVGRGTEPGVEVGPLIDAGARAKVAELLDDAVAGGAQVLTGGAALDGPGWFHQPTVLAGVPAGARVACEEIFGPVAPVQAFDTEAEGLALANDTEYGLVAYAYTRDLARTLRVTAALDAGMVAVNRGLVSNAAAPFGGVKASGLGREGGREGLAEYLSGKYVAVGS